MSRRFTIEDLHRKGFQVHGHTAVKVSGKKITQKSVTRKLGTIDPVIKNRINIKPLSVNECWKGQRYKTDDYISYQRELLRLMQPIQLPDKPYKISFVFGLSNVSADWDNPVKPLQDILQKRYGFNDKDIIEAYVVKKKVKKGSEYLEFKIETSIVDYE